MRYWRARRTSHEAAPKGQAQVRRPCLGGAPPRRWTAPQQSLRPQGRRRELPGRSATAQAARHDRPPARRRRPARGLRRRVVALARQAEPRAVDAEPLQPGVGQARAAVARRLSAQGADPRGRFRVPRHALRQGRRRRDDPQGHVHPSVGHGPRRPARPRRDQLGQGGQKTPSALAYGPSAGSDHGRDHPDQTRPSRRHARLCARLRRPAARRGARTAVAERSRAHASRRPVRVVGPREKH